MVDVGSSSTASQSTDDKNEFIAGKIEEYVASGDDDEVLWAAFQDNFADWIEDDFKIPKRTLVIKLRSVLRQRGV